MKNFQILLATLLVAVITLSFTSCSDDATSSITPESAFTKSATQPDSYMPLNQANTWTYTAKLPEVWIDDQKHINYNKDIVCNAFNDQNSHKVFSSKENIEYNIYDLSNQIWTLCSAVGNIKIPPFYNNFYTTSNNGVTVLFTDYHAPFGLLKKYDITSSQKFTKYDFVDYSLSSYSETITINGQTFDCVVVSTQVSSNYELTYFAKGYGLIKWIDMHDNVAFAEITLKSCSIK